MVIESDEVCTRDFSQMLCPASVEIPAFRDTNKGERYRIHALSFRRGRRVSGG